MQKISFKMTDRPTITSDGDGRKVSGGLFSMYRRVSDEDFAILKSAGAFKGDDGEWAFPTKALISAVRGGRQVTLGGAECSTVKELFDAIERVSLDEAIKGFDFDAVVSLMNRGVKPTTHEQYGNAFHLVVSSPWEDKTKARMIKLLADFGVDINYVPPKGNCSPWSYTGSPLSDAKSYSDSPLTTQTLLELGAQ